MIPRTSRTARPTTQRHIAWDLESSPATLWKSQIVYGTANCSRSLLYYYYYYYYYYIFNCKCVDTLWQQCGYNLHTNSTQNTKNKTHITKQKKK